MTINNFQTVSLISGLYIFRLYNGEDIILTSEKYTSISACKKDIELTIEQSKNDSNYIRKKSLKNSKYYFYLTACNGKILGRSNYYASESGREYGISLVKRQCKE